MLGKLLKIRMRKLFKLFNWIFFIGFCGCVLPAHALVEQSTKSLMQEKTILTQAWQLSENYAEGLTVKANPFKALAWQYVYVMTLPHAYPGIYTLLEPFKAKLDKKKINEAFQYSKWLIRNYQLPKRMDENQLIRVFEASEKDLVVTKENPKAFLTFSNFLSAVKVFDDGRAKRYKNQWQTWLEQKKADEQLVYGRLQINGGSLEQSVARDQAIDIDLDGFFIAKIKHPIVFNTKGYQAYVGAPIEPAKQSQSLGLIVLTPLPENILGSIVGSTDPAKNIQFTKFALLFKGQFISRDEPWFTPSIAVTKLDNGQFYVKGLAPGAYELIASFKGQKKTMAVTVGQGQVKTIKPITF